MRALTRVSVVTLVVTQLALLWITVALALDVQQTSRELRARQAQ